MDPNKYIKYSFYQMSDSVKAGGLFSESQCKVLAQKLINLYDDNKDGQLDLLDVGQMMGDCYRAMNKNYNPTPTDIASFTRKMDTTGRGRIDVSVIEQLCLKYLSSGVIEDPSSKVQDLPNLEMKIESKPIEPEKQIVLESGNKQSDLKQSNPDVVVEEAVKEVIPKPQESRQQQILIQTRFLQRHGSQKYSQSPLPQEGLKTSQQVAPPPPPPEEPKPEPPKPVQNHEVKPIEAYSRVVQERLKVARRIFTVVDFDQGGFITEQEVPQLLIQTYEAMGMTIEPTQEDVELWMEMADLDKDGKVYLADYEDLILRSLKTQGIKLE